LQLLYDNRNQHIGAHGGPNRGLHSVLADAKKVLDSQIVETESNFL